MAAFSLRSCTSACWPVTWEASKRAFAPERASERACQLFGVYWLSSFVSARATASRRASRFTFKVSPLMAAFRASVWASTSLWRATGSRETFAAAATAF